MTRWRLRCVPAGLGDVTVTGVLQLGETQNLGFVSVLLTQHKGTPLHFNAHFGSTHPESTLRHMTHRISLWILIDPGPELFPDAVPLCPIMTSITISGPPSTSSRSPFELFWLVNNS